MIRILKGSLAETFFTCPQIFIYGGYGCQLSDGDGYGYGCDAYGSTSSKGPGNGNSPKFNAIEVLSE